MPLRPDYTAETRTGPRDEKGHLLALHVEDTDEGKCLWCRETYPCRAVRTAVENGTLPPPTA
jgi:hypothetical protein